MRSSTTSGTIVVDDMHGIQFRLSRIEYTVWENGDYEYVFTPYYRVIDMLPPTVFDGIPGLDLDLRKERYVRSNMDPVFITERTPPRNREDLWELLASVGMDHYNRLEWLIRTDLRYIGDDMYVIRDDPEEDRGTVSLVGPVDMSESSACREIISILGSSRGLIVDGEEVDDHSAVILYRLLCYVISSHAEPVRPRGRTRASVNRHSLYSMKMRMDSGEITSHQAAERLGISVSTMYRRMDEFGFRGHLL